MSEGLLLKVVAGGNKVMALAGHRAVVGILQCVNSPKLLMKILDVIARKNPVLRNKCGAYLQCILAHFPRSLIEKYSESVENGISTIINDASADTRTIGRECYSLYEDMFPGKAKKLYSRLSAATQKAIALTVPSTEHMSVARESHNSAKENIIVMEKEVNRRQKSVNFSLATTLEQPSPRKIYNITEDKSSAHNNILRKETKTHIISDNEIPKHSTLSLSGAVEMVKSGKKVLSDEEFNGALETLIASMASKKIEVKAALIVDHSSSTSRNN